MSVCASVHMCVSFLASRYEKYLKKEDVNICSKMRTDLAIVLASRDHQCLEKSWFSGWWRQKAGQDSIESEGERMGALKEPHPKGMHRNREEAVEGRLG